MANLVGFPTTDRAEHRDGPVHGAIPLYIEPSTGRTFYKYDTDVESATIAELITVEYICSYVLDRDGTMWLVSEEGKGVARMTQLYLHAIVGVGNLGISPLEQSYEHDNEAFRALLRAARAQPQLREEARVWAEGIQQPGSTHITDPM